MDINAVTTIIGSLGFPIACCIALFWYITKQNEQHRNEMEKMSEAINNNTTVMTQLIYRIDNKGV